MKELEHEAFEEKQQLTPFFRYLLAYVGYNWQKADRTYNRLLKQLDEIMWHDLETYLKIYSRFKTKDLEMLLLRLFGNLKTKYKILEINETLTIITA